jgi:hypothetical protein
VRGVFFISIVQSNHTEVFAMSKRMSRRSAAVVVLEPEKKIENTLRKGVKRVHEDAHQLIAPGADESTLVEEERVWLQGRLVIGLEKTRNILEVFENDSLANGFEELLDMQSVDDVIAELNALTARMVNNKGGSKGAKVALKGAKSKNATSEIGLSVSVKVFKSVFSDEEWAELEESSQAVAAEDEVRLRVLRLQRQRKLLWDARNVAIELTVRDESVAAEESALVNESMQVMKVLLDCVGMNARGTMRRIGVGGGGGGGVGRVNANCRSLNSARSPVRGAPAPARQQSHQQRQKEKSSKVKALKTKSKPTVVSKKKRELEEVENEDEEKGNDDDDKEEAEEEEEEEEEGEQEKVNGEKKRKVYFEEEEDENDENEDDEKEGKEEEEVDSDIDQDDDDDDDADRVSLLLRRAMLDVDLVVDMLKQRNEGGGLDLKIEKVELPDPRCASAKSGSDLLRNDAKLTDRLSATEEDGGSNNGGALAVERWGTLLKWWRLVNRAFAIVGIFASLRKKKKDGLTLKERYKEVVDRLNEDGGGDGDKRNGRNDGRGKAVKVYGYAQAAVYDRLGQFLLKYPRFVYQMQLVTLKVWFCDIEVYEDDGDDGVGDDGERKGKRKLKMIGYLEQLLDVEEDDVDGGEEDVEGEMGSFWMNDLELE